MIRQKDLYKKINTLPRGEGCFNRHQQNSIWGRLGLPERLPVKEKGIISKERRFSAQVFIEIEVSPTPTQPKYPEKKISYSLVVGRISLHTSPWMVLHNYILVMLEMD